MNLFSQTPVFEWIHSIGFSQFSGFPTAVILDFAVDNKGNTFTAGLFTDKLTTADTQFIRAYPKGALFLIKTNLNGKQEWIRIIDGYANQNPNNPSLNFPAGLGTDSEGNVYFAGLFNTPELFFENGLSLVRGCSDPCAEVFIFKYGPDGNQLWSRSIGTDDQKEIEIAGISVAASGHFYISGTLTGSSLIFGQDGVYSAGSSEAGFLARFNPEGKPEWVRFIKGVVENLPLQALGADGSFYINGEFSGLLDLGEGSLLSAPAGNPISFFFARYSADGNVQDAHSLTSVGNFDILDMAADAQGRLYAIGEIENALFQENKKILENQYSSVPGGLTGFALRLKTDTVEVLTKATYIGGIIYPFLSISVAPDGTYYIGGYYDTDLDKFAGQMPVFKGCFDICLLKGQPDGSLSWTRSAGGTGCETISGLFYSKTIGIDAQGNTYLCGPITNSVRLDNLLKTGPGVFVAKLASGKVDSEEPEKPDIDFRLSPNPASGPFRITWLTSPQEGNLRLYDASGCMIFHCLLPAQPVIEMNISLNPGLYTVGFQYKDGTIYKKMVFQK